MRKSKDDKNNTTTTITPLTSNETPIEIALQIDKDGMTTASKLYAFLELLPSNFARWCKKNIVNNKFATENEDYFRSSCKKNEINQKIQNQKQTINLHLNLQRNFQ